MKSGSIIVIGDVCLDVMIAAGAGGRAVLRAGGSAGMTAMALGTFGLEPMLIGRISRDGCGRFIERTLDDRNVDRRHMAYQDAPMAQFISVVDKSGEAATYPFFPPEAEMRPLEQADLPDALLEGCAWVHANGFANGAIVSFMERAREKDVRVSFDLNLRVAKHGLDGARRALIMRAVNASTVVFGSGADEFHPLTGLEDMRAAARSLAGDGRTVVARDGAKPIFLTDGNASIEYAAQPVRPVNTLNAGDIFDAGYIAAAYSGRGVETAVRWGAVAAAAAISSAEPCAVPGMEYFK